MVPGAYLSKWQTKQSETNRSVPECKEWLKTQLRGDIMENIATMWKHFRSEANLKKVKFLVPTPDMSRASLLETHSEAQEDDFACLYARLHINMTFERVRRTAPMMLGWNSRSILFIGWSCCQPPHETNR